MSGNTRFNPPFSAGVYLLPFGGFASGLGVTVQEASEILATAATLPAQSPVGLLSNGFNPGGGPQFIFEGPGGSVELGGTISLRSPDPSLRTSYSMNWFLGVQRELPWDRLAEVNYVGNAGRKLGFIEQYNRFSGDRFGAPDPYDGEHAGDTSINRLNPWFTSENFRTNNVNSSYHGANVSLQKRFSQGLAFNSAFTFGKVLDYGSDNFRNNGGDTFSPNPGRLELERGRAAFDVSKRWVNSIIYEVPFMRGASGFKGSALGGWQVQTLFALQDGSPYSVQLRSSQAQWDLNGDGRNNDRPDAPSGGVGQFNDPGKQAYLDGVFGPNRSAAQAVFTPNGIPGDCDNDGDIGPCIGIGTLGRGSMVGPGLNNVDFSLFKNFRVPWVGQEDAAVQFRAEFFNLFNRVNLEQLNENFGSSTFGKVTSAWDAREIQFALKFIF